tara:strand:- start:1725 stop:2000 length:276 start_codon:yes stop_codon:yes gene_type:complete
MPLNKAKLISDIVRAQEKAHKAQFNVDGRSIFAKEMANAIDLFVKSGDVQTTTTGVGIVAPGQAVNAGGYPGATVAPGSSTTSGAGTGKVL